MTDYTQIRRLIASHRIFQAIEAIDNLTFLTPALRDELKNIAQTYSYMYDYMLGGQPDDSRKDQFGIIAERLESLVDSVERYDRKRAEPSEYYGTMRTLDYSGTTPAVAAAQFETAYANLDYSEADKARLDAAVRNYEAALDTLFAGIWVSAPLSEGDYSAIHALLTDEMLLPEVKTQIVSALHLGVQHQYDAAKIRLLIDAYEQNLDEAVRARALTGLLIVLLRHGNRAGRNTALADRLTVLADTSDLVADMRTAYLQMLRSMDTDRVNEKIRSELMPGLMRMQPDLQRRLSEGMSDMTEANPEWEEALEKSGLSSKLQELSEMQSEGSDVMMFAFSNLKNFPFFNKLSHWLLPYSAQRSELNQGDNTQTSELMRMFENASDAMCESDKYSMAFALRTMASGQSNMILSQLNEQMRQHAEEQAASLLLRSDSIDKLIAQYIKDLFRLHRLYRNRKDLPDPFADIAPLQSVPAIGTLLADDDTRRLVAEFYFKHKYYDRATREFSALVADGIDDAQLYQKYGFALESTGLPGEAIEMYRRAELVNADSLWLKKRLATVLRAAGHTDEAIRYMREVADAEPENVGAVIRLANTLLESGHTEEAAELYYKADYLREDYPRAWRGVAWSELLLGHHDMSRLYYTKLIESEPTESDYMNAGHERLLAGDMSEAVHLYRRSIEMYESRDKFINDFNADKAQLISMGADALVFDMLADGLAHR